MLLLLLLPWWREGKGDWLCIYLLLMISFVFLVNNFKGGGVLSSFVTTIYVSSVIIGFRVWFIYTSRIGWSRGTHSRTFSRDDCHPFTDLTTR